MKFSLDGIKNSDIVIICFSKPYTKSTDCLKELQVAVDMKKKLVMVNLDPDAKMEDQFLDQF